MTRSEWIISTAPYLISLTFSLLVPSHFIRTSSFSIPHLDSVFNSVSASLIHCHITELDWRGLSFEIPWFCLVTHASSHTLHFSLSLSFSLSPSVFVLFLFMRIFHQWIEWSQWWPRTIPMLNQRFLRSKFWRTIVTSAHPPTHNWLLLLQRKLHKTNLRIQHCNQLKRGNIH